MVTPKELRWGSYKQYEGPYWLGQDCQFTAPPNPDNAHIILDVISATEGSSYTAINAYDVCIFSPGIIQLCEGRYFLASKLFGHIADYDKGLLGPIQPCLDASQAEFKKGSKGRWRFHFKDHRGEVDEVPEQQELFLLNSDGTKGSWDEASKQHARNWVASVANMLAQPKAQKLQVEFLAARTKWFLTKASKDILLDDKPNTSWVGALRAAYTSFAANNPSWASKHLQIAVSKATAPKWSEDWCIGVMQELTFGPGISIYPHRYDKIRPRIEAHFGVDLPDFSSELKTWQADIDADHDAPIDAEPTFQTVESIQAFLADDLGFDIGPSGADGIMGAKTKDAIMTFQSLHGLESDGIVGKMTRAKMLEAWRSKSC